MRGDNSLRYRDMFRGRDVVVLVALATCYAATIAILLLLVGRIIDLLSGQPSTMSMPVLLAALAGTALVHSLFKGLEFAIPERIGFRIVRQLRSRLYRHMAAMTPRQIQHRSRGSLILRLTGDLTMLRTWLSRGMCRSVIAVFALCAAMGVVAWHSPMMAIGISACFAVGTIASIFVGRQMQTLTSLVRKRRSLLTSNVDEHVSALSVVQLFGRVRGEEARFDHLNEQMTDALYEEAEFRGILRAISSATGWAALVTAFAIGAYEASIGQIDVPTILVAILATRMMQAHVRSISLCHDYWRRAEISRGKLQDFLNSRSRMNDDRPKQRFVQNRARIEFEGVTVRGSLHGITAAVGAGQHIALVGPAGSGKTTLLHAISNMVDTDCGEVHIGEQRVDECESASLWRKMGFVGTDLPLMRGTLRRNLTYRSPTMSDENLWAHIRRCQVEDIIDSLPGGLDFWITEGGLNLPVGTRQRIAIARALLGNPPILLLDRATAGLDEEARRRFREMLARYSATIVSVTDDPQELAIADEVWTLEHGLLVARTPAAAYLAGQRSHNLDGIAVAGKRRAAS